MGKARNLDLPADDPRVNFYDVDTFFEQYSNKRAQQGNLNLLLIDPWLWSLIGDLPLAGRRVLDIGCGWGDLARQAAEKGAQVVGFDPSRKMIERARREAGDLDVEFVHAALCEFNAPEGEFDLAVSAMSLHYIEDLEQAFSSIYRWLKPGGRLCAVLEHPCVTGSIDYEGDGSEGHDYINRYFREGPRLVRWMSVPVVKQHHTLETLFTGLVAAGFRVERLVEPHPGEEVVAANPRLEKVENFPHYLGMRAHKPR